MKPLIGITVSKSGDGDFFLRRQYCSAVLRAGGIPLMLPTVGHSLSVLGTVNALLLSGGGDISPRLCGIEEYDPTRLFEVSPERDEYELELAKNAFERDIPTLGICRGVQVMSCALGGKLHFDIPGHRQTLSREQPSHAVFISKETLLMRLVGKGELHVNSFHHQSVASPGNDLCICARAEDGTVEAVEAPKKRFFMGVQWHPEHMIGFDSDVIFAGLCAAACHEL